MVYRNLTISTLPLLLLTLGTVVFFAGCQEEEVIAPVAMIEVPEPVSPFFLQGQAWGEKYDNDQIEDYALVTVLYDLGREERIHFLDGFAEVYTALGKG